MLFVYVSVWLCRYSQDSEPLLNTRCRFSHVCQCSNWTRQIDSGNAHKRLVLYHNVRLALFRSEGAGKTLDSAAHHCRHWKVGWFRLILTYGHRVNCCSETTGTAIFDFKELGVKTGISSRVLKPTLGIIDQDNMKTMPVQVSD